MYACFVVLIIFQLYSPFISHALLQTTCTNAAKCTSPVTCSDPSDCELTCSGTEACSGAMTYECTHANANCIIKCLGNQACPYLEVSSNSSATVWICDGTEACYQSFGGSALTVSRSDMVDLYANLTCIGNQACRLFHVKLSSPATNSRAYVSCRDASAYACRLMDVDNRFESKQCQIECENESTNACWSTTVTNSKNQLRCYTNGIGSTCTAPTTYWNYDWTFQPTATPAPTMSPSSATASPSRTATDAPSAPSLLPTAAPTFSPTLAPSLAPTENPTQSPTGTPTAAPSQSPTAFPTAFPSQPPTAAPSVSPTLAPTFSPTARPTFHVQTHNLTSNYIMNDDFGLTDFEFPAAVDRCMHAQMDASDQYMKYECIDEDNAVRRKYTDNACSNSSVIADSEEYFSISNGDDLECGGSDTFIDLGLFSSSSTCSGSARRIISVADSVCSPYDALSADDKQPHFSTYCSESYSSEVDTVDASEVVDVFLYYFHDVCGIFSFDAEIVFNGESTETCLGPIFTIDTQQIYGKVYGCFTLSEIATTSTSASPSTAPTEPPQDDDDPVEPAAADISGYVVVGLVLVVPLCLVLIAFCFHRKRKGSDTPGYLSLFKFSSSVGDFYTDAIFALTLYNARDELWYWACAFSFGPHFLSVVIGLFYLTKWRQTKSKIFLSEYAERFDKVMIILTLLSGFYAATEIATSHLFHVAFLSLPLSEKSRARILNLKIVNNVILENMPMFYIQYLYLAKTTTDGIFANGVTITLLAIAFSATAIVFGVLTVSVRVCNGCIELSRRRKDMNRIYVEFTFKSSKTGLIQPYHAHTKQLLKQGMRLALYVELSQIEIVHVQLISSGIRVKAKIKYVDRSNTDAIIKGLKVAKSELFSNLYKECTQKLEIKDAAVSLEINSVRQRNEDEIARQQTDVTDLDERESDRDGDGEVDDSDAEKNIRSHIELQTPQSEVASAETPQTLEDY